MIGLDDKKMFVGDEAMKRKGMLALSHPLDHGVINDWDAIEALWSNCFYNELRVSPNE